MPRRIVLKKENKLPGKRLQRKLQNFLVNKGLINRKGVRLDANKTFTVKHVSNKEYDVSVFVDNVLRQSYTVTVGSIYKNAIFTYTETYDRSVSDFMKEWSKIMKTNE